MMNPQEALTSLSNILGENDFLPKNMDIAEIGNLKMVNSYDEIDSKIICNAVTTGIDKDIFTATLKALSEYYERRAFQEGFLNNDPFCQTERSDGFAAFPTTDSSYKEKARENALNEAIERYVWASWWDNPEIQYDIAEVKPNNTLVWKDSVHLLWEVEKLISIESIKMVFPKFNDNKRELIILFVETKDGVISGGACGSLDDIDNTILKAMGELARHALGLSKMRELNVNPQSFYEKRLQFFATPLGFDIYKERFKTKGCREIELPELAIDNEIYHKHSDCFYVHRCLFKNQPPFVGGDLERLCL